MKAQDAAVKHHEAVDGLKALDIAPASLAEEAAMEYQKEQKEVVQAGKINCGSVKVAGGVYYMKAGKGWSVRWKEMGKQRSKWFPVKRYCTEGMSFVDASRLAQDAAVKYHKAADGLKTLDIASAA